jgi:RHS repeat-associated protein
VTDSYDFKAYGETNATSGSTVNVFKWVGELGYYLDVDRLAYYLRARPYSPKLARFLSEDPIDDAMGLYPYTSNAPISYVDPSGQTAVCCTFAPRKGLWGEFPYRSVTIQCNMAKYPALSIWAAANACCRDWARRWNAWSGGARGLGGSLGACGAPPPPPPPYRWWEHCSRGECENYCDDWIRFLAIGGAAAWFCEGLGAPVGVELTAWYWECYRECKQCIYP